MYAVGRLGSYIQRGVYTVSGPFHPFGGAVDIVVVQQEDGSFKSSRWNVRFGKFQGVLKAKERIVRISVNEVEADFTMYLDHKGEAYFLREVNEDEGESLLHPTVSPGEDTVNCSRNKKLAFKSKSFNFETPISNPASKFDGDNGKTLTRAASRRSGILSFVFGRSSLKAGEYHEGDEGPALTRVDSLERAEIAADLLEVKWSTNLSSLRPRKKDNGGFSDSDNTDNDSTINLKTGESHGNVCSNNEQIGLGSESGVQECNGSAFQTSGETTSLSMSHQVVEHSAINENVSELMSEVSKDTDAYTVEDTHHSKVVQEIISERDGLALHNPVVEDEGCLDRQSVMEKDFSKRIFGIPASDIHKEELTTDGSQQFIHSKLLESSNRSMQCPTEVLNLGSGRLQPIHTHSEVLRGTSETPPHLKVTLNEEYDPEKGQNGGPENYSQQTDISCSCVSTFNDADAERPPTLTKPEAINSDHCKGTDLDFCSMSYETLCRSGAMNIDISNLFPPPLESANDCGLTETAVKPPSISSEEEANFIFGDLDENNINEGRCINSLPSKYVDCPNVFLPLSADNVFKESTTADLENCSLTSSPIRIHQNHCLDGGLTEQCIGSVPVMSSHSCDLGQHDIHYPLSHSVDSKPKSFSWEFVGKCVVAEGGKKLFIDDGETKDMDISAMFNTIAANPAIEISLCKHLLYEGMGANAASAAFDSEKLDIEKLRSLGPQVVIDERLVVRIGHCYYPWDTAAPNILGMTSVGSEGIFEATGMIPIEKNLDGSVSKSSIPSNGNWRLWPFPRKSRSQKASSSLENGLEVSVEIGGEKVEICPKLSKNKVKAHAPTSEQLASLNLMEGRNIVTFTFCTDMLGNQQIEAQIYLWKWNTRIVISDVDGTITKSDVLGQFMPLVGIDWSQTGVAHLFSAIKENGYQLLFLSARAISQAFHTRRFLFNLKQNGKALPDGPVFISPDGLFPSLYREVIRRAPHEFKIACLEDIKGLFPSACNPFYAGFGNRDTDEISYLKVGIPRGKIFIINPKGEVAVNQRLNTKSYTSLQDLVNGMFPPMKSSEQEDFNAWNYWKLPPPVIDI